LQKLCHNVPLIGKNGYDRPLTRPAASWRA
jgi:hypothetical protein